MKSLIQKVQEIKSSKEKVLLEIIDEIENMYPEFSSMINANKSFNENFKASCFTSHFSAVKHIYQQAIDDDIAPEELILDSDKVIELTKSMLICDLCHQLIKSYKE